MTQKLFSIFDSASNSYDVPRAFISRGVALRSLMDAMTEPNTPFYKHPQHFSMFYLGEFDQETARITLLPAPELVANLWELKEQE